MARQPKEWKGPERFTAFTGERTFLRVDESAYPRLMDLAERFPKEFSSALKGIGNEIRGELKYELRGVGPIAASWAPLSRMHMYRRMDMLKNGWTYSQGRYRHGKRFQLKKRLGHKRVSGHERLMERWKGRSRDATIRRGTAMGGRLVNAMRYKMVNPLRVDIGAVTPSAAKWLDAVQSGKRGADNRLQFTGSQPITPAMRRAFWAAGIPLKKDKTTLEQPQRLLVLPVYTRFEPLLVPLVEEKIAFIIERNARRDFWRRQG